MAIFSEYFFILAHSARPICYGNSKTTSKICGTRSYRFCNVISLCERIEFTNTRESSFATTLRTLISYRLYVPFEYCSFTLYHPQRHGLSQLKVQWHFFSVLSSHPGYSHQEAFQRIDFLSLVLCLSRWANDLP